MSETADRRLRAPLPAELRRRLVEDLARLLVADVQRRPPIASDDRDVEAAPAEPEAAR